MKLRVKDDDKGEITVSLDGKPIRNFWYETEADRRFNITLAREYIEGFYAGLEEAGWEEEQEPEPLTYDEALGAKCDAQARYERDMIDAGRGHLLKR